MEGRKESGRVGENYSKRPCASCRIDDGRGASDGSLGAKYWLLLQQSADRSGEAARVGRLGPVAACSLLGGLSLSCVVTPKGQLRLLCITHTSYLVTWQAGSLAPEEAPSVRCGGPSSSLPSQLDKAPLGLLVVRTGIVEK